MQIEHAAILSAPKRGLIISPEIKKNAEKYSLSVMDIDAQQLRFYLLFWDELAFAKNAKADTVSPEVEFLQSAGILRKTHAQKLSENTDDKFKFGVALMEHLSFELKTGAELLQSSHSDEPTEWLRKFSQGHPRASSLCTFRELDGREPGIWSLASAPSDPSLPTEELLRERGILFKLFSAIPVPNEDVPLQDILEFREKRSAELISLRVHLERVYQCISKSADMDLALQTEIADLQRSLVDLVKTTKASKLRFRLCTFDAKINLIDAALRAYVGSIPFGNLGAVLGAASSFAKFEATFGLPRMEKTPFEYVSSFHRELI